MIFGGGQLRAWQHVMVMENKIKIVFCLIRVYFLKLSLLEASEVPALEPLASASPFTTDEFVDRLVAPRLPLDESSSSTEVGVDAEVRPGKIIIQCLKCKSYKPKFSSLNFWGWKDD